MEDEDRQFDIEFECQNCFKHFDTKFPYGTEVYEDAESRSGEHYCWYGKKKAKVECPDCGSTRVKKTQTKTFS